MNLKLLSISVFTIIFTVLFVFIFSSCSNEDNTLAPYVGSSGMSDITIEENSFTPQITWLGGYVSVVGVNTGLRAALDTSLIWLIYMPDDQIHYPVEFGTVPAGAQNLTDQYNGTKTDSLIEDSTYTFWVMKASDWKQISSMQNKIIVLDSTITESISIDGDTIRVSPAGHTQITRNLDNYINISEYAPFGKLGTVYIEQPRTSNNPLISWQVTQDGVSDSLISAMGIVEGNQYNNDKVVWEVYSVSDSGGNTYYGKKNVIMSPVISGQELPETFVFTVYPESGLKRNKTYYIWIANKDWDAENRTRVTKYYAYATFNTY